MNQLFGRDSIAFGLIREIFGQGLMVLLYFILMGL